MLSMISQFFLKKETIYTFLESQKEKRGKRSRKLFKKIMAGFPGGSVGKESACQCRRRVFNPWSGKIPHAAEQPSPCATTAEPGDQNSEPMCCDYKSLSITREATAIRRPRIAATSKPCSPQLRKSPRSNEDPGTAKNK